MKGRSRKLGRPFVLIQTFNADTMQCNISGISTILEGAVELIEKEKTPGCSCANSVVDILNVLKNAMEHGLTGQIEALKREAMRQSVFNEVTNNGQNINGVN